MESHLDRLAPLVLSLYLLIHLCLAAPGLPGTQREDSLDSHPPPAALPNPFGTGEEERRLLQSFVQSSLKNSQDGAEIRSWEQEVFFLFRLYDYDRSGFLDGLEMMKLLSDYNSLHASGAEASEMVVSMVDFLLQTQDLNHDGLLNPSELLSPSSFHTQGSIRTLHQEQEVVVENQVPNTVTEDQNVEAAEHRQQEAHDEVQHQQEVGMGVEEPMNQVDRQTDYVPAEEQEQINDVPVHQGQSEI
uniref:Cell growth regulator with EF-hand domain 1 n=1 Tax=Nothobranchius kadleci TaxID=1051664 RepID=A0A1A8EG21_NOTKA